jgi:hypothetical protein
VQIGMTRLSTTSFQAIRCSDASARPMFADRTTPLENDHGTQNDASNAATRLGRRLPSLEASRPAGRRRSCYPAYLSGRSARPCGS